MTTQITTEEFVKEVLTVEEITAKQLFHLNNEYNAKEWQKKIDRYSALPECKFYRAKPQRGYEYDRFYVVYVTPEEIRFFNEVSYTGSLSSNGFCRISIEDGSVKRILLKDSTGKEGRCANDAHNRKLMARDSQLMGFIYSNLF